MKTLRLLLLAGAALFAMAQSLPAQTTPPAVAPDPFIKNPGDASAADTPDDGRWLNSMLVLEVYALDKHDALAVLESERGSAARYRRVTDLVKPGKARLEILTALITKSGQRAVVEAHDEVRYPTEFARPVAKGGIATPTAFETRNVGDTLEFDLVIHPDRRTCDVNLIPQRVSLLGFRDIGVMAEDSPASQPQFSTQKLVTSTSFPAHEAHYLGSLSPATGRGAANGGGGSEMWLAFLRMNLVGPTADEMKQSAKPLGLWLINFEYSIYSLDRAAAREILVATPEIQAPWKRVQALLAEKKARFEHLVSMQTKSGQRTVIEEVHEVRYGTEYAPAARPTMEEKSHRTVFTKEPEKAFSTTTTETATVTRLIPNAEIVPGFINAFETRNAGMTVEVEPVVGPDRLSIDLNHVVTSTTHLGDLKVTGVAARYPAQPLFEMRRFTTSQTALAGRQMLIGTFNPPGANGVNERTDDGRTWLIFVRASLNEP